ncbi:MAG: response regulator, partial [Planctomycetales bacterium]|nr:response regulator [Planctomycetales bacterium]
MVERTVLCVDDEENVLRSLKRLLRREPFKLLTANGAAEGLAAMGREPVHLVISDHRMPEMTGTEFLAEVQRRWPETVRVVLSGFADAASVVEAINEGRVFRFLAKPWNDDELKANIRACLDQYELIHSHRVLTDQLSLKNVELRALTDRLSATVEERTRVLRIVQNILRWID